ncbi:hypothetical protein FDB50_15315 [Clostridium botulinum]|uniref:Mobilization protein n=1 Tax=Clostridium botulinum TaxID=1491 RepID=A0A846JXI2_CLOBO|nr:hypothetical protein [Clostridium botulinum]NFN06072.1 hypothetical protein [Clostridium botulinum]NFN36408.1 hypothetical protein [Clostridium botulinum]
MKKTKIEIRLTDVQKEDIKLKAKNKSLRMSEYILNKIYENPEATNDIKDLLRFNIKELLYLKVQYCNQKKECNDENENKKIENKLVDLDKIISILTAMLNDEEF